MEPSDSFGADSHMVGLIIITHGDFGRQLVKAAETIIGKQKGIWAVSLGQNNGLETLREKIAKILKEKEKEFEGKIILVDMFGGTPANASLKFANDEKVEIISGVNLPMLIAAINYRASLSLKELTSIIRENARESILDVKEIFHNKLLKVKSNSGHRTCTNR